VVVVIGVVVDVADKAIAGVAMTNNVSIVILHFD